MKRDDSVDYWKARVREAQVGLRKAQSREGGGIKVFFWAMPGVVEELEAAAARVGMTRAEAIRDAIGDWVWKHRPKRSR